MDGKGSGVSLLVMVLAALSVLALADEDVYYSKLIENYAKIVARLIFLFQHLKLQ